MPQTIYTMVLAMTPTGVIGMDCVNADTASTTAPQQIIPWDLPEDLQNFRAITAAVRSPDHITAVLMGRKTYDTVAPRFTKSVFPGRIPIVLSATTKYDLAHPEVIFVDSINPDFLSQYTTVHNIGGANLINNTFNQLVYDELHITHVNHDCTLITPESNPARVDMVQLDKLLTNYDKLLVTRQFNGKCSLCNAAITADYNHYKLRK
ncbi:bifunctional dihydrofolate reductase-thymidylate synthase [Faustovirus]|nr:bifunctional dihydrofolate reductase-thymidylate synthase [Faustovirus]